MNAWKLPDGRVLIPKRVAQDGIIGDGLVPVAADSAEAREWEQWTLPAPADVVEEWMRMKADMNGGK